MERMDPLEFKKLLESRTENLAVETFKLLDALPKKNSTRVIAHQLGKSASSIGANYQEANRAESRADFVHKLSIALKEASESNYWFRILSRIYPEHKVLKRLSDECLELLRLIQSISRSARMKEDNCSTSNCSIEQTKGVVLNRTIDKSINS